MFAIVQPVLDGLRVLQPQNEHVVRLGITKLQITSVDLYYKPGAKSTRIFPSTWSPSLFMLFLQTHLYTPTSSWKGQIQFNVFLLVNYNQDIFRRSLFRTSLNIKYMYCFRKRVYFWFITLNLNHLKFFRLTFYCV